METIYMLVLTVCLGKDCTMSVQDNDLSKMACETRIAEEVKSNELFTENHNFLKITGRYSETDLAKIQRELKCRAKVSK